MIDTHTSALAEQMIVNAASVKHMAALNIVWNCATEYNTVVMDHPSIDGDRCDLLQTAVKIVVDE